MELFECSEYLKLSRESRNDRPPFRESASPFIGEGDGLTRERVRESVLQSLVAHAIVYKMIVMALQERE